MLSKAVREQHGWAPGTEFVIESTPDGVRLLVNDDQPQGALARRLFEAGDIFIGVTVLLESAWVLESVYELSAGDHDRAQSSARP